MRSVSNSAISQFYWQWAGQWEGSMAAALHAPFPGGHHGGLFEDHSKQRKQKRIFWYDLDGMAEKADTEVWAGSEDSSFACISSGRSS